MSQKTTIDLPTDYALVLQQIQEDGEDNFTTLAETVAVDRPRLVHIIDALRNKGLILVRAAYGDTVVALSHKGRKFVSHVWPETLVLRPF